MKLGFLTEFKSDLSGTLTLILEQRDLKTFGPSMNENRKLSDISSQYGEPEENACLVL